MNKERENQALLRSYQSSSLPVHCAAVRTLSRVQQGKLGPSARRGAQRIAIEVDAKIPPLSWLCMINGNDHEFRIGRGVEAASNFIIEGVWDGSFADGAPQKSDYVFGSGAVWRKHLIFVPPKHCWEYLFVLHDHIELKTYVSNSFNFIFAKAGVEPASDFFHLVDQNLNDKTNKATAAGIDLYDPIVARNAQYSFYRMMFYNFLADADGNITLLPGTPAAPFEKTYSAYRSFLEMKIAEIFANGKSPLRKSVFHPITSISSGYDSACVSILARSAGCRDALTIAVNVRGADDSALEIARQLDLDVCAFSHIMGDVVPKLDITFDGELRERSLEFLATAGIGDDITFLAFEPRLAGRIFLNGSMGDSVWRRNSSLPPGLPVRVVYGKSISEFRLRVGFAFVPVPAFGARFPAPIKEITRSEEMAPYTLWAPYDRPFPRRVIEEAGIERGTFARVKAATSPTPTNFRSLFRPAVEAIMCRYS